jgi:hypothetical protein
MGDERELPTPDEPIEADKKRLMDRVVPELVKRLLEGAVERGVERLVDTPENVRNFVGDLKLPKEVLHYLYTQIDETKNGLYRVVAKEIRDVLEHTQFAEELTKVLTKLSFEIKTEIRFVPSSAAKTEPDDDDDDDGEGEGEGEAGEPGEPGEPKPDAPARAGLPKPEIRAQVSMKDRSKEHRRDRRRREGT